MVDKVEAFVRKIAGMGFVMPYFNIASLSEEARALIADLPQPVDPNIEAALDCLTHSFVPQTEDAKGLALACILRGRALERGES